MYYYCVAVRNQHKLNVKLLVLLLIIDTYICINVAVCCWMMNIEHVPNISNL